MTDINLEEEFIQTNGTRLSTILTGPKSGPPVILLHGFPEFWRGWIRQLPALVEAGFRVIIPDQRGYNLGDKPQGIKNYRVTTGVRSSRGRWLTNILSGCSGEHPQCSPSLGDAALRHT